MFVLDPSLVAGDTVDSNQPLAMIEENSVRRRIRQNKPDYDGPKYGNGS